MDSSLWKDHVGIHIPPNNFSKLDFVIGGCLNGATKELRVIISLYPGIWGHPTRYPYALFPSRYLINLATRFPNLKRVELNCGLRLASGYGREEDIPAPWIKMDIGNTCRGMLHKIARFRQSYG